MDNDERDFDNARKMLEAISQGVAAEVAVLDRQTKDLDELIAQEAVGAYKLANTNNKTSRCNVRSSEPAN